MEQKKYSVLIIDDHPLILEAYKKALDFFTKQNLNITFSIEIAQNCDEAIEFLNAQHLKEKLIDIVFLDIKLPPSKDGKILSGEDLGILIKKFFTNTKIIISTTFNDNYRIHSLFRTINPDGFLIKNDITNTELIETIGAIINDPPYYSKTVVKLLRKQVSNDLLLDYLDRKLLYELSIGTKMKELPNILPLSIAGIEKRKRHLKEIFHVENGDDKELLLVAREKGFI